MDDLSLFTNSDFFDYEVFAKDLLEPIKQENIENIDEFLNSISNISPESIFIDNNNNNTSNGYNSQQQQQQQQQEIKQEFIKPSLIFSPGSQDSKIPEVKEVKKQRNTAASARFRIKKKQKQQEMELKIYKLNEDISNFNNHIKKLEIENRILKNLVFEKGNNNNSSSSSLVKKENGTQRTIPNFLQKSSIDFHYTI